MRTVILTALAVMFFGSAEAQVSCYTYGNITNCTGMNTPSPAWTFGQGMATGAGILESQARTNLYNEQADLIAELRRQQIENAARFESFKSRCFNNGQYIPNCY
jgi:hypothetical protein